jgi:histidine triad (HIT) family protein
VGEGVDPVAGKEGAQEGCLICRKHRGEYSVPGGAIFEDELVYAGHAQIREGKSEAYLGYLMAETGRHVPKLSDLTDAEAESLGWLVARLSRALAQSEGAEHVYAFAIGDGVPHVHVHVVPRYPGAPREYWGVHVDEWPNAPHGGAEQMEALCRRLRTWLENESRPAR